MSDRQPSAGLSDAYREAIRRWVFDERPSDDKLSNRIITTFDAGPLRELAWQYVNELRGTEIPVRINRARR